jgi:hypothetical protein
MIAVRFSSALALEPHQSMVPDPPCSGSWRGIYRYDEDNIEQVCLRGCHCFLGLLEIHAARPEPWLPTSERHALRSRLVAAARSAPPLRILLSHQKDVECIYRNIVRKTRTQTVFDSGILFVGRILLNRVSMRTGKRRKGVSSSENTSPCEVTEFMENMHVLSKLLYLYG